MIFFYINDFFITKYKVVVPERVVCSTNFEEALDGAEIIIYSNLTNILAVIET